MIRNLWNTISNFGVSTEHPEENDFILWFNRMSLLTVFSILGILLVSYSAGFSQYYVTALFFLLPLYSLIIFCNYFGKIYTARYMIVVGTPLWICLVYFLMGGFYCQGAGVIASICICYATFRGRIKERNILIAYSLILFFFTSIYVNSFGPLWGVIDFPFDELVVFFAGLGWAGVTLYLFEKDRIKLLKELKNNNVDLKNTTEELERFTYIASHDLKSPLRTIISFIGLVERDLKKGEYENITENLNFIKTGAEQMNFLVRDILELTQLKNENKASRVMIDLNRVLQKVKSNLSEDIKEKNAVIIHDELPIFYANELEFILLFQNFIQNGIKYNESQAPTVQIKTQLNEGQLTIVFEDNGIGVEKEYYEKIFQFFKRLHTSEKYQGTGLGLGLCKKIITQYDGVVEVNSLIGRGTKFTLSFPISEEQKPSRAIPDSKVGLGLANKNPEPVSNMKKQVRDTF